MIISHFARLNSIFWIKGFIKLSEWQRRKERGKREIVGGEKKLRKGILRYLVWLYYELILLVLRKFNYTQDSTCLCVCVCVFLGSGNTIVCEDRLLLPQHPPRRHQTELRPEWQSECRFHVNDQRAWWLCVPTTKGFTVPMMSGERELSGRAREKKGGSSRQGLCRNERRSEGGRERRGN